MQKYYRSDISREFIVGERVAIDRSSKIHVVRDFGLHDVMEYSTGVVVATHKHMGEYMIIVEMDLGPHEAHTTGEPKAKPEAKSPVYGLTNRMLDL